MHGTVSTRAPGLVVAATDAAYKQRSAGVAYITSGGRWGLRQRWDSRGRLNTSGPSAVLVAELRAAGHLLEHGEPPSLLLSDSQNALSYLQAWQRGEMSRMPPGYSLRPRGPDGKDAPCLVRLAQLMAGLPSLRLEHVRSHSGHPLNEAADALASLAMRRLPAGETRVRAAGIAEAFIGAWACAAGKAVAGA